VRAAAASSPPLPVGEWRARCCGVAGRGGGRGRRCAATAPPTGSTGSRLTYAGSGCFDHGQLRTDVAAFFRELRAQLGGKPLPYLWVPEWHPGGHGLHVHFAVGRYVKRSLIERVWGRGRTHIKLIGDLPVVMAR